MLWTDAAGAVAAVPVELPPEPVVPAELTPVELTAPVPGVASVEHGVALVAQGLAELLGASAGPLGTAELVAGLRGVEAAACQGAAVSHRLLAQCEQQRTATVLGHRSLEVLLRQMLRISAVDAQARIRAARVCGPRWSLSGEVLGAVHPVTAAAAGAGVIGVEHTRVITQILHRLPARLDPAVYAAAERSLASFAATLNPEGVVAVGQRLLAHLDPDGQLSDDDDRARRRGLGFGPQGVDLMSGMSATLTPVCRAKLDAVFAKLACPGAPTAPHTSGAGDSGELGAEPDAVAVAADTRTQAQRNHDGLQALCDLVLGSPRLGSHRGLPVTAIITMTLTEVEHAAGVATTASGGTLPIADALTMAQRAHPVLVVFDHHGRALHLGRGTRLANADQRLALIATERGCSKPGCTVPADRCQVHHIRQWADDGATNIDNLTLACPSDHAHINPSPTGWATTTGGDPHHRGHCAWTAPTHLDPTHTPHINHSHHPERLLHTHRHHHPNHPDHPDDRDDRGDKPP